MEALRGRVADKLEDTLGKLGTLWDRIGISDAERDSYLEDLGGIMDELLTDAVETTAARLRDMEEEVRSAEASVVSMNVKLGNGPVGCADQPPADAPAVVRRDAALAKLSELRDFFDARAEHLKTVRDELHGLWEALGAPVEPEYENVDEDLSTPRVTEFEARLNAVRLEATERREAVVELVTSVQGLMQSLKVASVSTLDMQIMGALAPASEAGGSRSLVSDLRTESCVGISSEALEQVTIRQAELKVLEKQRRDELTVLGEAISKLYDRLDVSEEEQAAFAASVHGLGEDTISAGQRELTRLQGVLVAQLSDMVAERRETITQLWDEMGTSDEGRAEFRDVMEGEVSEDLLTAAEEAVAKLQAQAAALRPILRHIDRRAELTALRTSHAEQMKDPEYQALLTGRSRQARLALKELEATEKGIKKELPKITEALRRRLKAWESQAGKPFMYQGRRYLDRLEDEEAQWESARQQEKRDKVGYRAGAKRYTAPGRSDKRPKAGPRERGE